MNFRREPALLLALFAAAVQVVSAFLFALTDEQQAVLNGAAVAAAGLITAAMVVRDQLAPAILGFVQALLALGLGFGLELTPEQQSVLMAFAAAVVAAFVRTQVTAPVGAPASVS